HDLERVVAARLDALHPGARPRHPRRGHARGDPRDPAAARLRGGRGDVPGCRAGGGRRGVHDLLRARGDAGRGARRRPDRRRPPRAGRPCAAGGAAAGGDGGRAGRRLASVSSRPRAGRRLGRGRDRSERRPAGQASAGLRGASADNPEPGGSGRGRGDRTASRYGQPRARAILRSAELPDDEAAHDPQRNRRLPARPARTDAAATLVAVTSFRTSAAYSPTGDQPQAIEELSRSLLAGNRYQTLLGATGTGKTATMAWIIEKVGKPALVIAHNKTLAAQLCNEFREFMPGN